MNIPSTYHKRFKAKGFTKNKQKTHINGFIDKKGKFKKLNHDLFVLRVCNACLRCKNAYDKLTHGV
jgi:hypothetical protein